MTRARAAPDPLCGALAVVLGVSVLCLAVPAAAETRPATTDSVWTWKRGASLGIVGTTYLTAWGLVSAVWWTHGGNDFALRDEGSFGLGTYAGGADKLGHVYANYVSIRLYTNVLEWGGFSRKESLVSATVLTAVFFTAVELKDGYQPRYGFSIGDMVANLSGEGAALGLALVPGLGEAVSFKLMYSPSRDFRRAVAAGGPLNMPEDYTGQTYLVALHLAALPFAKGELNALRYLDISLGYGTRGYEPTPAPSSSVRQLSSFGLSLNLQSLFDDLLDGPAGSRTTGSAIVHFGNEIYQPPYTRLPLLTYERTGPPRSAD